MNRSLTGTVLWTCFAGLLGAALFFVKHEVKDLETKLASVKHEIIRNQEDIHVLNAEWSFLNDPVRLRDLAQRHLGMKQMGPTQVATLDTLNGSHQTALPQVQYAATKPVTSESARQVASALPAPKPAAPAKPTSALAQAAATPVTPTKHIQTAAQHPRIAGGTGLAMVSSSGEAR